MKVFNITKLAAIGLLFALTWACQNQTKQDSANLIHSHLHSIDAR